MENKKDLEEILNYEVIAAMFFKNPNSRFIIPLYSDISEIIEEIRNDLILEILRREQEVKKGNEDQEVQAVYGFANRFVHNKMVNIIKADARARRLQEKQRDIEGCYDIVSEENVFGFQKKEAIMDCLNRLKDVERNVLLEFFYNERQISEIAEQFNRRPDQISQIKLRALRKLKKRLLEKHGKEIEDIKGTLHDISLWQEITNRETPPTDNIINNSSLDEENTNMNTESMDKEYTDMLLHTIYQVAKIAPVSDMIDEYLYGRLKGEQKDLFEKHLLECQECYDNLKERKNLIPALKSVFKDIE